MLTTIPLRTEAKDNLVDITQEIRQAVRSSGVAEGLCVALVPHTTAAITVNSAMDPATLEDIVTELRRLVPTRVDFKHTFDTPADAAGHIKAALIGNSASMIVSGGELVLGSSQSVLFYEFDGPRDRRVLVRVMADVD